MSYKTLALALTFSVALSGCVVNAQTPSRYTDADDSQRGTTCVAQGTWFDPAQGKTVPLADVINRMRAKDIVLLGETHTFGDHHRWQVQTIAQLYLQNPDLILGFEAFPRRVQGALDRWVAGELSEDDFVQETDWETVWRYDIDHYMPLFQFARMNNIPMVALNVDRTLTRKVSQSGWNNVPQNERLGVGAPAPAVAPYVEMLAGVFGKHDDKNASQKPTLSNPDFSHFVDVQLTWDRAMAEAADNALKSAEAEGRTPQLIVIVGRGHVDHFMGIPVQLNDLGRTNFGVLTPWDDLQPCSELNRAGRIVADAVFGIERADETAPPPKPKLGVLIESGKAGIHIRDVIKGSIAEQHGLQKDDVIVKTAGAEVKTVGDLVSTIKAMPPGTILPLTVKRGGQELEILVRFPTQAEQDAALNQMRGQTHGQMQGQTHDKPHGKN